MAQQPAVKISPSSDQLTRFLLPGVFTRGAIIRGSHIIREAKRVHGLNDSAAELFGQGLISSILLLSISKGGIRQVLQLDTTQTSTPLRRIMAEARPGAVRGFMSWEEKQITLRDGHFAGLGGWVGNPIRLSTVRDMGVGQPYISTIEHNSSYLADHIIHYLNQSVQVRADVILHGDLGLMIEAMPGCDEEHWFKGIEAMAKISGHTLEHESTDTILSHFSELGCNVVGSDAYAYRCDCNHETMRAALHDISEEQLHELADEDGAVTLSCQYCNNFYTLKLDRY